MGAVTIQQMADRVADLLKERLGVRGGDLAQRLNRAGRRLPRRVRAAGLRLALAAAQAQSPKLLMQIDEGAVAADYDTCLRHLSALGRGHRVRARVMGAAARILLSILGLAILLAAVLRWRGFM